MHRVAIIDYNLCNIDSIRRAIEICGATALVTNDPSELSLANHIILPGVGAFAAAVRNLKEHGMDEALCTQARAGTPILGICLGMQLLASTSSEGGLTKGLDLIPGTVKLLARHAPEERIPHVGWNEVNAVANDPIFRSIPADASFYFVHSYHVAPTDSLCVIGSTPYCGRFTSAIRKNNVVGVQFHPEKSQRAGFALLKNFLAQ